MTDSKYPQPLPFDVVHTDGLNVTEVRLRERTARYIILDIKLDDSFVSKTVSFRGEGNDSEFAFKGVRVVDGIRDYLTETTINIRGIDGYTPILESNSIAKGHYTVLLQKTL